MATVSLNAIALWVQKNEQNEARAMRVQPNANNEVYATPSHFRPRRILGFYFLSKCSIVDDMNNPIAEQFRVALNYLLQQEGRGAQVRLALAQNIDRGYLNAVIKGRKPAAEEIRLKIADHFGMLYEEILVFGRRVQDGRTLIPAEAKAVLPDQKDVRTPATDTVRELQERDIAGTMQMALELLSSGTGHNDALTGVITALHRTMRVSGARKADTENDRFKIVEKRLAQLEAAVLKKSRRKR